jgi:CcmD family protein
MAWDAGIPSDKTLAGASHQGRRIALSAFGIASSRGWAQRSFMKNFANLFAAWMFVWAVFFVYEVSIARRMAGLRRELDDLKQQLRKKQ